MSLNNFLDLLFDGAPTCFADNPHGHRVYDAPVDRDVFFCINSLHKDRDLNPTQDWHNPNVGRRSDANVSSFSSFLLEIDSLPLSDQIPYVQSLGIPYTSCVFSGSKSHHFIITLQEPLKTYDEYMAVSRRLHKLCTKADPSTKNPSRLSRLPFRVRPETGLEQKLLYLGDRIPNDKLLALLPEEPKRATLQKKPEPAIINSMVLAFILAPEETMREFNLQSRNLGFYWLGKRMEEAQVSLDKRSEYVDLAYGNLKDTSDFSINEARSAARVK